MSASSRPRFNQSPTETVADKKMIFGLKQTSDDQF